MDAHLTFKEHHNGCMRKARAAEARLHVLMRMHGIVPKRVRPVQVACVQAVALYRSELWWDPNEIGRIEDHQLLRNRQARSTLGALPTTPLGQLMRVSGLTPAPVVLDSRWQRFASRLASECEDWKQRETYNHRTSGAQICGVIKTEHEGGREAETTPWARLDEQTAVRTVILSDDATATGEAKRWASEREAKLGGGASMLWMDGSRSDDSRVEVAALCNHRDSWKAFCSHLATGQMED